ncbi:glycosyltransferase [Streptomyces sp. NPDC101455]|uniref:glycosyltransferase n=1 Tax=Streptomyces sp. NPDC101455 TaxID=3366142 RepID=UPI003830C122
MTPRILYLLNVSNPGQLSADSGWQIADQLAPALADVGAEVVVASPARAGDRRTRFERMPAPVTKYRARFDPGMGALVAVIRRTSPDVVVANQVEAAPAVRAALIEARSSAQLACYCHYLPFSYGDGRELRVDPAMDTCGLGRPVLLAFAAGLAACDRVLVQSSTAASWVTALGSRLTVDLGDRIRIVPPPRDERLVRDPEEVSRPHDGEMVGIYNHRLYAHYGTPRFVRLAERLTSESEANVRLRVMDLFGVRSPERIALDDSPERMRGQLAALPGVDIVSDGGDRATYRTVMEGARFALAPFRPGCPWSMSVIDCQGMGLPVISPRIGWLAEHVDDELLFTTSTEALALVDRLAGDPEFYAVHAKRAHASTAELTTPLVAARYLEAIS